MLISQAPSTMETTVGSVVLYTNITASFGQSVEGKASAPRGHHCDLTVAKPRDLEGEKNYYNWEEAGISTWFTGFIDHSPG